MKLGEKNSTENCFDVTMGSFDDAEICKLVGLYIQSNLENILPKTNFALYRDDGLILLRNHNCQQIDKKKKKLSPKLSRTFVLVWTFK